MDGSGTRTWELHDALGSVRQHLAMDGSVVPGSSYAYPPFGVVASGNPPAPFGFTGELHSQDLVYLRARWYDPSSGVFTGRDPFAGFPEQPYSLHYYQYGYSAPTMWTDPSGNVPVLVAMGVIGALAGAGGSIGAQLTHTSGDWSCINWGEVAVAAGIGGLASMVTAGTGFGTTMIGAMVIGGGANVTQYSIVTIAGDGLSSWKPKDAGLSAAWGLVGGAIAGPFAARPAPGPTFTSTTLRPNLLDPTPDMVKYLPETIRNVQFTGGIKGFSETSRFIPEIDAKSLNAIYAISFQGNMTGFRAFGASLVTSY